MPVFAISSMIVRSLFRFHIVTPALAVALLAGAFSQPANATAFQQFRSSTGCSNASLCEIDFPAAGAKRVITITNVSCLILIGSQTVEILQAEFDIVNQSDQAIVQDAAVPVLTGRAGLGSYFAFNHQTLLTFGTGLHVRARVASDVISSMFLQCKVAGDIRVLP